MKYKTWKRITSVLVCAAMMLSMHMPAISLTIDDIKLTPNASDLKVEAVKDKIDAIGTVEYNEDYLDKIVTAEDAYAALNDSQKAQVENYGTLVTARNGYNALAADKADTSAYTITDNGTINSTVKWYVYDNGVLEIAGTGSVPSYSSNAPWQNYVSSITTIIVRSTITGIGSGAFSGCSKVTSITLPFVGKSRTATGWEAHFGYIFGYSASNITTAHNNNNSSITLYRPLGSTSERYIQSCTVGKSSTYNNTDFINGYNSSTFPSQPWYTCRNGIYNYNYDNYYGQIQTYTYSVPATLTTVNITDADRIADGAFNFCCNITNITLNDGITSIGKGAFQRCTALKDYAIPTQVTELGEYAFNGDTALTEIYIPDGVTAIEPYTFYKCSKISRFVIGKNVTSIGDYAFYGDSAFTKLVIPEKTDSIGSYAFAGCTGVTAINIPDTVTSLGTYAFSGDNKAASLSIGSGVGTIPSYAFENLAGLTAITVPDTVTAINAAAFSGCSKVTSVTLPFVGASRSATGWQAHFGYIFGYSASTITKSTANSSVKLYRPVGGAFYQSYTVGTSTAFNNTDFINGYNDSTFLSQPWYTCRDGNYNGYYGQIRTFTYSVPATLTTVNITDANKIADGAFNFCCNITNITLNDGITSIGKGAFQRCTALKDYAIPNGVTEIGECAFNGDIALTEVYIPNGVTTIGSYTFYQCSKISRLDIGKNVTSIGDYAFYGNSAFAKLVIPEKTTSIGSYAFANCTGVTAINIPDTVTLLGTYAFSGDNKVTSLSIGSGVRTIPSYAFENLAGLTAITVPDTVTAINAAAFSGCSKVTSVTLPFVGASRSATGWQAHFGYIFGYSASTITKSTADSSVKLYRPVGGLFYQSYTVGTSTAFNNTDFINGYNDSTFLSQPWYTCRDGNYNGYYGQIRTFTYSVPATLTTVNITDADKIADGAFNFCCNITNITLNDEISKIGAYAFQRVPWYNSLNAEFNIVGDGVLIKYTGTKSNITFPETVKYIGGAVFERNTAISEVTISDQITGIGAYAFDRCTNLTGITIPKTVTSIGREAIPSNCTIRVYRPSAGYDYRSENREILNNSYTTGQDTFYYIIDDNDLVEIIGTTTSSTEITVPEEIEGKVVQRIGDYGFAGCTTLNSITIPSNIKSIGNNAFDGCTGLINATIPTTVDSVGDYAFNNCTQLKNVTISEGVKSIGKGCFRNCTSLVEAVVPDTAETLGAYAFCNCTEMTTATIGISAEAVEKYTFYNCEKLSTIVIGISVEEIGDYAFYNCALQRVTVPATVTKIGKYAFGNNRVMTKATLRKNLLTIGEGAFRNCEALASVSLPSTVTSIGRSAFENCASLPSVTIPSGVTVLNDFVFSDCSSLASVTFNSNVTRIGESAFCSNAFTAITLPDTVEMIDKSAFRHCVGLTSINIPDATKTIGDSAFIDCTALSNVSIPDDVQSVGTAVFAHNNDLTAEVRYLTGTVANGMFEKQGVCHVILDENITKVGDLAFANCYDLKDITYGENAVNAGEFLFSANVTELGSEVFKDAALLKNLILPDTIQVIGDNAFYNPVVSGYNTNDVKVTFYYVAGDIAASILKDQRISHIYVNDNIKTIGDSAFNTCTILDTISLPDTITSCGSSVFANSGGNVTAYFRGVDGTIDAEVYRDKTEGLTYLVFDENIGEIGSHAFSGATSVKGVLIKDTDTIKDHAFADSSSIYGVVIEKSNLIGEYAFYNNTALDYVEIGSVDTIDKYAFSKGGAKRVEAGSAVNINDHAFAECTALEQVEVGSVVNINDHAFAECTALEQVEVGSVVNINDYAFYDCIAMDDLCINADLVHIGEHAFEECKLLPKLVLPDTVREIGAYAFYNCNSLANINIPSGVPAINSHTFFGCASLLKISLPDTVNRVEDYAYYGCVLANDLILGSSVTFIGEYAFYNCNKVTEVIIPETVVTIEDYAFRGCTSIKDIYLPDSVTDLGDCVFYACVGLEKAEFGTGVTSIGDRVFYACVNLTELILNGDVGSIHDLTFYGVEDVVVYTPYNEYVIEYCDDNGIEYVITDHAHNYSGEEEIVQEPTCTESGIKRVYCSVAGCREYQTVMISALGHDFGDWQVTKEATFTEDGEKAHSCSRCGITEKESIPKLGEGHIHDFTGREEVINEPACMESGVKRIYCADLNCGEYIEETLPPLGHLEGEWEVETEPTCTEAGLEVKKCTRCGVTLQSREIEATGHTWDAGVVTKEPTCVTDGVKTFTCTKCGETITKPIPAIGHAPGEWVIINNATCAESGTKVRYCTVCGEIVSEETIPETGHQYGEWVITIHPSETTPGEKERTCSVCGHKETQEIDPTGAVPKITVDDIQAHLDEEITVNVDIADNPGIISISLKIGYDNDVLELLSASAADFAGLSFGPAAANPLMVTWEDVLSGNNNANGTFVRLKFKVKDTAATDTTKITISYDDDNVFDENFDNVFFDVQVGEIEIVRYKPGDVNRDGNVNMKDYALLKQYINGWDVDIELSVADVTGDGNINMKDYALLKQYINGWDVVLK